jgi:hypothetical protein
MSKEERRVKEEQLEGL